MNQKRSVMDIPIFHKMYDLYKVLNSYQSNIGKAQRYRLWQRCENLSLSLLELLISTSHRKGEDRVLILNEMSNRLDILKVLIRLAKETRTITIKQYTEVQAIL